jgi:hypothetical protein
MYLPKAIGAGLLGALVGVGTCAGMGGAGPAMAAVGAVVAIAALIGLAPVLFPPLARSDRFGLVVLAATMLQTLLAIGAAVALVFLFDLPRRPVVLGAVGGVFLVTMLQAIVAVTLLNALPTRQASSSSSAH